jgi:hypothetical protein
MTASPPLNGHARPPIRIVGDWQPVAPEPEPVEEQRTPQLEPAASELVAQAQAEAIRAQAWADAEKQRIAAETEKDAALKLADAEAEAIRIKAAEAARRMKLANDKQERQAREEDAASEARIAESNRLRDEANRAREDARKQAEDQQADAAVQDGKREKSAKSWRNAALGFAVACAIVALPVQMSAFYNPHAKWLLAAPVMLEGGAWVVLRGAAAAVDDHRPHWHYRLIAWLLAFVAAAVNLSHGISHFDLATAIGTAFASLAGPGVWDLHEHGRIRKRDGVLTRRERKAQRKAERAEASRKAAEEKQLAVAEEAARKAAEAARQELREIRQTVFKEVWTEAVKIGAALGKEPDDPAVWPRAYRNIEGCEPGESIASITARRAAEKRVEAALTGTPVNTLSKTTNAQRAIQIKNPSRRSSYRPVPPVRKTGDTPPYHPAARRAHGETKRRTNAAKKDPS